MQKTLRAVVAKLRAVSQRGGRPERVSILLPFLIISVGVGALAWRSYTLSLKMERGASAVAEQYANYAAEITARRVDAAVRAEMARAWDEWQHMERAVPEVTFVNLRDWITQHPWIVSAMYLPDYDPASSVYANETLASPPKTPAPRVTREFFTYTGSVRYTYEPERLLAAAAADAMRQQPLTGVVIRRQADVALIRNVREEGLRKLEDAFASTARLSAPLESFGIRAVVRTEYVGGRGWQNQRLMSLWVSLLAIILTGAGAILAYRGMQKEAEATNLRAALIANVSHELRTPLSMIRLGAETLKLDKLKEKERRDIEDQILREVLLLSHLVENVLDVARIQNRSTKALAFTPVYPSDLIHSLIETYDSWIRSRGFNVSLVLDEDIEEQMWDRDAVSRALLNLVDNAIKYSGENRAIEVVLRQTDAHVVIEVRDHGIGIDAKDVAKIFDPYYRARFSDTISRRGAGLGLTLVQQIVESHGGRVEVESQPGSGSTFRLLFPRELAAEGEESADFARAHEAF
ncbi:MAG TPA: HAMP domain-containing sensor histidine kinase [Thermoanaerobaculia bacterium]|nr:HAMP domain-containing sensor histidine kinase [Thermoanaerobaculia bacterium]